MDIDNLTIESASKGLKNKDFSAVELTEAYVKNIEEKNKDINAYLEVFDDALDIACQSDKRIQSGESGKLLGVPISIKDNILIDGHISSAGSRILESHRATYDATVVSKLKERGVVFLGRTNMDEFAMGSSTENSAYGVTLNPHDKERVSGGSSGGSSASVSMNGALASLGSDTGGSIRQPASFCGVVGLKPTYGAVSRSGLIALGSSLDQIGPITKTVKDAEILFEAIKGNDKKDSTTLENYSSKSGGKVVGVPRNILSDGVDKDVLEHFDKTLESLKKFGYEIRDIELPYKPDTALAVYYIIMPAEASTNLARFDGIRYGKKVEGGSLFEDYAKSRETGFGEETKRRIVLGTYVLSAGYYDAYYGKATSLRHSITKDLKGIFESGIDLIATPTTPSPSFKIGEKSDPISMYLEDIFTVSANLTGMPAISIPNGEVDRDGKSLPVGFQMISPHMHEKSLFDTGKDIEASI
ncbi:MAG: Asp-tRNA(Asn)/Glu-tRNA(Gln) amidotransferase subunit GatA [Candidatus Pacebacteria bacterium]|jgi:aspartyl-tRNA(Asn)/glutamyl-tRNA(Gln) amidotransferase subunit A|nr:Asp-tRNA(Asn)/Glu-tRNA(Gln) amidotransferase GatCAB subunit A [bacterium]MDP6527936.1 Asp-tRNA(Asn)/Glu-tRNA(Gln) amidotransferase subunit GatA [Candidatus Paceibacterota bacterium]MDP6659468.1 Asp-tRNA(Asn)/Glu-tRNA(Gln) amidotransferase subunit GatA [Candidatus Paceibacterota bacterium]|tara:strand:- start:1813 stop:3225 length:1413 start_codon:yes stop_codon:yes gene_type:complete